MSNLRKASLHITGIVQGVGFRPFVYGLATRFDLKGWVRNTSAGVDIEVDGSQSVLEEFISALKSELPPLARMDSLDVAFEIPGGFTTFEIIHSEEMEGAFQPISPDVSICSDCLGELFDPADRRYRYPFTNCTNCGPRFTIITDIPYDRPNTTMADFPMCPDCAAEYQNPLDRRFHAQPVACPVCGPKVWLEIVRATHNVPEGYTSPLPEGDNAILEAQRLLAEGKILAAKGLGGFHLACDATNAEAVCELRDRKLRVDKPFALMMPDLATVERHCFVSVEERTLLESRQRPVVLLKRRPGSPIVEGVAPKQDTLGVMLPYTPLHYLLLDGGPLTMDGQSSSIAHRPPSALVMTSGNLSEEPIATDNDEGRKRLASLADAFLMHNRDIRTRCDDSVVRLLDGLDVVKVKPSSLPTFQPDNVYFLRRSRGYAPDSIHLPFGIPPLLAAGPELKNTFCLTRERYAFLSHHIGDMENYETLRSFEDGVTHYERLFRIQPEAIVHDQHPDYLSTRYALQRAGRENLPTVAVQHHHAHIAACMADNCLDGSAPVIGLSFDGTGYGPDGAIWGGEFLLADYAGFERKFHLAYFPLPGGDASIKRPARTALALLWSLGLDWDESLAPVQDLCYEERMALRVQLERDLNSPRTSSLGRVFDAAAALAGVRQRVNYEAQAAMEFESALDEAEAGAYRFGVQQETIDPRPAIAALLADVRSGVSVPAISARFHNGLAELTRAVCDQIRRETGVAEVALSGGVWQNMALLTRAVSSLRADGFTVYLHRQVPANDGGLSLGQALAGAARLKL
ncbi:MAG: carbamoyltransferase HypF [Chloroflexi bacterium]|nr:carbamoyltransferase HypF [Chloroflexota bacterium]